MYSDESTKNANICATEQANGMKHPANFGITKHPELKGLHGQEYRRAWNKLHKKRMTAVSRRFYKTEKGRSLRHKWHLLQRGSRQRKRSRGRYNVRKNNQSRKFATMSRQKWGPVEDAMLYDGTPQSKLVHILGRSIFAIQQRKVRLKKEYGDDV